MIEPEILSKVDIVIRARLSLPSEAAEDRERLVS
jgi:hypothetical protein